MGGYQDDADGSVGRPDGGTIQSTHRARDGERETRDVVRRGHETVHEQPGLERHELPGSIPVDAYHVYSHGGRWDPTDAPLCRDGNDLDWLASDEWLAFDVDVRESGPYDLAARVAAAEGFGGGHFGLVVDNDPRRRVRFDATGDWYTWNDIETRVELPRGLHTIRVVVFDGSWKLDRLEFR